MTGLLIRRRAGHRRFCDTVDQLTPEQMKDIEERVTGVIIEIFGVDLSGLVFGMTNFATYLDPANTKTPIAQRDHAKQKRFDLKFIGLGLIVSTDGGTPLLPNAYSGNRADVSEFSTMVRDVVERFGKVVCNSDDLTMVSDTGQDSSLNQSLTQENPRHFVGSLPPIHRKDLLAIAKSDYVTVDIDRFPGVMANETTTTGPRGEHRVILTHSRTSSINNGKALLRPSPRHNDNSLASKPA